MLYFGYIALEFFLFLKVRHYLFGIEKFLFGREIFFIFFCCSEKTTKRRPHFFICCHFDRVLETEKWTALYRSTKFHPSRFIWYPYRPRCAVLLVAIDNQTVKRKLTRWQMIRNDSHLQSRFKFKAFSLITNSTRTSSNGYRSASTFGVTSSGIHPVL